MYIRLIGPVRILKLTNGHFAIEAYDQSCRLEVEGNEYLTDEANAYAFAEIGLRTLLSYLAEHLEQKHAAHKT